VIAAATDAANTKSARVLGRLGMHLLRRADHQGLDTLFYGINRSEWSRGHFMPGES
jgi:RimJ/RimL family protein N-acetyltransferase